jgi:hypothetical protein
MVVIEVVVDASADTEVCNHSQGILSWLKGFMELMTDRFIK